jgi:hypothetical protein
LSSSSSKPPLKKKQGKGGVAQKTGVSGSGAANGATKLGGVTPGASGAASAATITAPPHHPKPRDPITNHACFFGVGAATNRFFADVLLPLAVHDRKRLEQMVVFAFHTEDVQRIVSGYLRPLQVGDVVCFNFSVTILLITSFPRFLCARTSCFFFNFTFSLFSLLSSFFLSLQSTGGV